MTFEDRSMACEEPGTDQDAPATPSKTDSSIVAGKYATGQWMHSKGQTIPERYPTDKEIARSIKQQISASVETYRNYRHVAWYTVFVAIYLLVLYFQVRVVTGGCITLLLSAVPFTPKLTAVGCFVPSW
jgi:hypothetical protein